MMMMKENLNHNIHWRCNCNQSHDQGQAVGHVGIDCDCDDCNDCTETDDDAVEDTDSNVAASEHVKGDDYFDYSTGRF